MSNPEGNFTMTIIVGTDTNQTVAEVDAYWSSRGNLNWATLGVIDKEVNLRKAADYLERNFRWRGTRKTASQRLGWPRDQAFDNDDFAIGESVSPLIVKEAEAIVADLIREGIVDISGIVTSGSAAITKEKVDVIEVQYDAKSRLRGADVISHVHLMLIPVTLGPTLLRA